MAYDIKMIRKTINPPGMPSSRVCSVSYPKPLRIRPENYVLSVQSHISTNKGN